MVIHDCKDMNMYKYIYRPEKNTKEGIVIKEFCRYTAYHHRNFYFNFFSNYVKDTDGIELEYSEKSYDFWIFPKVIKMHNLRIPTGNIRSFEGACRCSFGIAYHMLGYSKGDMEMERSCYIDNLLDNPKINTVARAYLLGLSEKGYFENMHCDSIGVVNDVLKDIGLRIEE